MWSRLGREEMAWRINIGQFRLINRSLSIFNGRKRDEMCRFPSVPTSNFHYFSKHNSFRNRFFHWYGLHGCRTNSGTLLKPAGCNFAVLLLDAVKKFTIHKYPYLDFSPWKCIYIANSIAGNAANRPEYEVFILVNLLRTFEPYNNSNLPTTISGYKQYSKLQ